MLAFVFVLIRGKVGVDLEDGSPCVSNQVWRNMGSMNAMFYVGRRGYVL